MNPASTIPQPAADKFSTIDKRYLDARRELADELKFDNLFEIADHFGLFSGTQTIGRVLAIYEAFKQTIEVPGDIFEFGCWKGSNLLYMAKLLTLFQPNSIKQVYGFDSFEGLQTFSKEDGPGTKETFQNRYQGNQEVLEKFIRLHEMQNWVHLVVGNAMDTIDQFDEVNQHSMASIAYIDFDLYDPCKKALQFSDRRLSIGGLIILDEALTDTWKGEGQALREFMDDHKGDYEMQSNTISRQPTVILKKIR
jgi:SAM-dependent methyltransferase